MRHKNILRFSLCSLDKLGENPNSDTTASFRASHDHGIFGKPSHYEIQSRLCSNFREMMPFWRMFWMFTISNLDKKKLNSSSLRGARELERGAEQVTWIIHPSVPHSPRFPLYYPWSVRELLPPKGNLKNLIFSEGSGGNWKELTGTEGNWWELTGM